MTTSLFTPFASWARPAAALLLTVCNLSFMTAVAQAATTVIPRIDVVDVTPTDNVAAGTPLSIRVEGTPNGKASTRIEGVNRTIILKEVEEGIYEGDYTLRKTDKLPRNASVKATLRVGKRTTTDTLDGGLTLSQAATTAPVAASGAVITRFANAPIDKIEPGADLNFTVEGSPGAKVIVRVPGVKRDIALEETTAGRYEGSYTVRQSDKLAADARATTRLTLAGKTAESTLGQAIATLPTAAGTVSSADASVPALPLRITSHHSNATVGSGAVTVSGTTLPGAGIDVSVTAVASLAGLGLNQSLLKERVEADAKGNFTFTFRPPVALRGVRYDISLSGYKGAQTGTVNMSLTQSK